MRRSLYSLLVAALLFSAASAGDTAAWKKRTVYQLLTDRYARSNGDTSGCNLGNYCGGSWDGVTNNLQYIKDLGFDAIWISPVVDNIDGGYHGYWAANWEKLNSHFGDQNSLKRLVSTAHNMGIWVMVDVVANHVGPVGNDFSRIYPFNQASHYHSNCDIVDWNNQAQVEYCRLAQLPDLDQSNSYVRQYLKDWIKNLVNTYGFDGIRIDTIPEVSKQFWAEYGQASGVFQMGEVFNGDSGYVGDYQHYVTGLFNYPMYYTIKDVFMGGRSMWAISQRYKEEAGKFTDLDALGLFVDNHDNARFLSQNGSRTKFKSALAFALTGRGIPFFYYGSEQAFAGGNDPNNREPIWNNFNKNSDIYVFIKKLNAARASEQAQAKPFQERWVTDNLYVSSRGNLLTAVTNIDSGVVNVQITNHPYANGQKVCNIYYPGQDCPTVQNGALQIYLNNGEVKAFLPADHAYFRSFGEPAFLSE